MFELDNFTAHVCRACGNYSGGRIEDQILGSIRQKGIVKSCTIKMKHIGNKIHAAIKCMGSIPPLKKTVSQEIKVVIITKKRMCDACQKISGGYYEAVLQIRGDKKDEIARKIKKNMPESMITGIKNLKEGYDIRIADKKIASKAASQLRKSFSVKESYKLIGDKKGKKLYRNFYAVK